MARVLVVDDAAFMRKVLTDTLSKGGHEVVGEAANGLEAVDRFRELRPELTTLDITMPEKDGLTALREILSFDPGAKIVMCSALGQESKVLEAIRAGAKDFVVKPFQPERVLDAVSADQARAPRAPAPGDRLPDGGRDRPSRIPHGPGPSGRAVQPHALRTSCAPARRRLPVGRPRRRACPRVAGAGGWPRALLPVRGDGASRRGPCRRTVASGGRRPPGRPARGGTRAHRCPPVPGAGDRRASLSALRRGSPTPRHVCAELLEVEPSATAAGWPCALPDAAPGPRVRRRGCAGVVERVVRVPAAQSRPGTIRSAAWPSFFAWPKTNRESADRVGMSSDSNWSAHRYEPSPSERWPERTTRAWALMSIAPSSDWRRSTTVCGGHACSRERTSSLLRMLCT